MKNSLRHAIALSALLVLLPLVVTACVDLTAQGLPTPVADDTSAVGQGSTRLPDDTAVALLVPTLTPTDTAIAPTVPPEDTATLVIGPTATATPQPEPQPTVTSEPTPFLVGNDLTIAALRARTIQDSDIVIEQTLADGANYAQYIASYRSEGNKIYGLLTVPYGETPEGGHPAIVFVHGYIPPSVYRTTERYVAYVDALARAGFVVFKIDLRGFGNSEGEPRGAYFSPDYTVDTISALKSLQNLDYVNPDRIGVWGHSMAGNVTLRAMLMEPDIQAGVIWAGAVYSYDDMVRYAIDDPSYRRDERPDTVRRGTQLRETYGPPNTDEPYWQAVSLTEHIEYLQAPLQIHHAQNDDVVNIGYSQDLAAVLDAAGKAYELNTYAGGGHNITSPYFADAMQRTIDFFRDNL